MLAMLAGCGRGNNGGSDALAGFERTSWNEPFPETVTATISMFDSPNFNFEDGQDVFDHMWHWRWLELYNIDIEVAWASYEHDLSLNLAIAAGDLPDMFGANPVQFAQLMEAGLIEDISGVINSTYASPFVMRLLYDEPEVVDTARSGSGLYAVPSLHNGFETLAAYFWVRRDLYELAGRPTINTLADMEALMATFVNDLGMEYGIGLHGMSPNIMMSFWDSMPMFHAMATSHAQRFWVGDGQGNIVSNYELPETFEAISTWRRWHEEGLVRQDFATMDRDALTVDLVTGQVGLEFGPNWRGWQWGPIVENIGPEAKFIALPFPTVDGRPAQIPISFPSVTYHVVRRGFEHPEILPILTSDRTYLMYEAIITGSMTMDEIMPFISNHMQFATGPFGLMVSYSQVIMEIVEAVEAHERGETPVLTSGFAQRHFDQLLLWLDDGEFVGFGRYSHIGHRESSLYRGWHYAQNGQFLVSEAWGPMPQEVLDLGAITDSIIEEGIVRIISGLDPLESWHDVLESWRQAGGNEMTRAINEAFR